jgi:hypothetical protein
MDDSVARLHRALAGAIRQARGGDFDQPVTVSEIYQVFMPYRTARSLVGFEMNADYEYALLRLLSGEGDFAHIEPAEVRELLRGELESANPNVSAFRAYANCDVWIAAPGQSVAELVAEHERDMPEQSDDNGVLAEELPVVLPPEPPKTSRAESAQAARPAAPAATPGIRQCPSCNAKLPAGRATNYCPFCGHDLSRRPCPACGEALDPAWRFCANCGQKAEKRAPEAT